MNRTLVSSLPVGGSLGMHRWLFTGIRGSFAGRPCPCRGASQASQCRCSLTSRAGNPGTFRPWPVLLLAYSIVECFLSDGEGRDAEERRFDDAPDEGERRFAVEAEELARASSLFCSGPAQPGRIRRLQRRQTAGAVLAAARRASGETAPSVASAAWLRMRARGIVRLPEV
jgi:hypothetical protein